MLGKKTRNKRKCYISTANKYHIYIQRAYTLITKLLSRNVVLSSVYIQTFINDYIYTCVVTVCITIFDNNRANIKLNFKLENCGREKDIDQYPFNESVRNLKS